jgi:hypothetical protein
MRRNVIIGLMLLLAATLHGQDSLRQHRILPFVSLSSGVLAGEHPQTGKTLTSTTSLSGGLKVRQMRVGVGMGFDSYPEWQTMPLYGTIAFDLSKSTQGFFVQFSYGHSFAWMQENEFNRPSKEEGGRMINPMIGYFFTTGPCRVGLSAGYKFQRVWARYDYLYNPTSSFWPGYGNQTTITQNIERVVVSLSVGWR